MRLSLLPALLLVAGLAACAARPPASDPAATAEYQQNNDPLEPTNRFLYRVNDGLDTYVLRPVAVAYRNVVPGVVRGKVHNLVTNIRSPVFFANDVMQGKPRRAGDTMMRFLINSTVGVGGLFDVASDWGYPEHGADFGETMALWGVGEGPFLFLPVLGPSNVRDAGGLGGDVVLDPFTWAGFGGVNAFNYSRYGIRVVDTRERLIEPVDDLKRGALDPYASFRSAYQQNRRSEIENARNDRRATVPAWFNR